MCRGPVQIKIFYFCVFLIDAAHADYVIPSPRMENKSLKTKGHEIINENIQKIRNEFFSIPNKQRVILDLTIIFVCCTCLFVFKREMIETYRREDQVVQAFTALVTAIILFSGSLMAFFDTAIVIFLRLKAYSNFRYSMLYGIANENTLLIASTATSFVMAGCLSFITEPKREGAPPKGQMKDDELNVKLRLASYVLTDSSRVFLGTALALLTLLVSHAIMYALNYRMYTAHYSSRISKNKADFEVIKLFKIALRRRIHDCAEASVDFINIINGCMETSGGRTDNTRGGGTTNSVASVNSASLSNKLFALYDSLALFYGKESTDMIFRCVEPHRQDLVTAEEVEMFCRATFNEMDQLANGLVEKDLILDKLQTVVTIIQSAVAALAFLTCLGRAKGIREYGMLIASAVFGAGYVFSSIIVEFFKSLVFVLIVRPFDVGDVVVIDGKTLLVHDIGIVRTTFLTESLHCTIPNERLAKADIYNLRLSTCHEECFPLRVPAKSFAVFKDPFLSKLHEITDERPTVYKEHCQLEQLALHDDGSLELKIRVFFRLNFQELHGLQARKDNFMQDLNAILTEMELL